MQDDFTQTALLYKTVRYGTDAGGSYKGEKNAPVKIEHIINPHLDDDKPLLRDVSSGCKNLAEIDYDAMSLFYAAFEYVLMYGYDIDDTFYLKIQSSDNLFACSGAEIEQHLEKISENVCSILGGVPYIKDRAIISDDSFHTIDDAWESRRDNLIELISNSVGIVQFAYSLSTEEADNIKKAAKELIANPSISLTAAQSDDIKRKKKHYELDALDPPGHESQLGIIDLCNYMLNSPNLSGGTHTLSSLMNEIIYEYNSQRKVSDINQTRSTEQAYKQGDGSMVRDPYICTMVGLLHGTNSGIKNADQGQEPVDELDASTTLFAGNKSCSDNSHMTSANQSKSNIMKI